MIINKYCDSPDEILVKMICQYDSESAFDELYTRYARSLIFEAIRSTGSKEIAEEQVGKTFVEFWLQRKLNDFPNIEAYLSIILKNNIIRYYGKIKEEMHQNPHQPSSLKSS